MKITVSNRSREFVRKRAQDHMISKISIYRPVDVTFNSLTGMVETPTRDPWYVGKARIWQQNTGESVILGEANVSLSTLNISIPFGSDAPKIDDVVTVALNPSDPTLEGTAHAVVYYDGGGMIGGTIRMSCRSLADSAEWQISG